VLEYWADNNSGLSLIGARKHEFEVQPVQPEGNHSAMVTTSNVFALRTSFATLAFFGSSQLFESAM
jgi:hypothetical protein